MNARQATIEIAQRATLRAFGEATLYVAGGPAVEVTGIFDAAYLRVEAGKPGMQSAMPAVFYRLADLPSDPMDVDPTSIVIRGIPYTVAEVKKDGQGGVLLHLHRS